MIVCAVRRGVGGLVPMVSYIFLKSFAAFFNSASLLGAISGLSRSEYVCHVAGAPRLGHFLPGGGK
jgi:hypothetical protein